MKRFFVLFLACLTFAGSSSVIGSTPPRRKTLAERVELATHVIVGTAKKVTVCEFKDGKIQKVEPEPEVIAPYEIAEVEIEVNEVLYPLPWKPKKTVRYFFRGGWFEVASIRSDTVGKKLIYLMKANEYEELKNESDVFFPSYDWNLAEQLEKKTEILAALEPKIARDKKTAQDKK